MARIIVEPASTGNDLPQRFVNALNLLNEKGIKLHSGTKLVSKYAVIVAEDPYKALEHLRAGNITAFVRTVEKQKFRSLCGDELEFHKSGSARTRRFTYRVL